MGVLKGFLLVALAVFAAMLGGVLGVLVFLVTVLIGLMEEYQYRMWNSSLYKSRTIPFRRSTESLQGVPSSWLGVVAILTVAWVLLFIWSVMHFGFIHGALLTCGGLMFGLYLESKAADAGQSVYGRIRSRFGS